jgi:hypothetical protein
MAAETLKGPREAWGRAALVLLDRVEDDARGFVVHRDLEQRRIAHPAERDAIVEVQRARTLFVDQLALQARPREHQQLRVGWNLQCVERRA